MELNRHLISLRVKHGLHFLTTPRSVAHFILFTALSLKTWSCSDLLQLIFLHLVAAILDWCEFPELPKVATWATKLKLINYPLGTQIKKKLQGQGNY